MERMKDDGCHAAFMIFVWSVDVEELQSGPKRRAFLLFEYPFVDLIFRAAVRVERDELLDNVVAVVVAQLAATVGGGG